MQNNSVNKGIFNFLGNRIWVPMPVYHYENHSRYITAFGTGRFLSKHLCLQPFFSQRFSFFPVFLVQWLHVLAPWWTLKRKYLEFRTADPG